MVDPITTAGAVAAMAALKKVAGPSLDVVGEWLKDWTEYRLRNVQRVVENAAGKLGEEGLETTGSVPPRVLSHILQEGSYSEDDIMVEYLGGVLASSKTPVSRDDRGAKYTSLVARLSSYQVRSHYIWYSEVQRLLVGRSLNLYSESVSYKEATIYMPFSVYDAAMEFGPNEHRDAIFGHALHSLREEGLIRWHSAGTLDNIREDAPKATEGGMVIYPSVMGIELYLWGLGYGQAPIAQFLSTDFQPSLTTELVIPQGSHVVADMVDEPRVVPDENRGPLTEEAGTDL